ncbi:MAG: ABC transporter permease [Flavobacteriaceae bacterium]|tara:strand:- start:664 stop:1899 length:1236 start_codon:yes stop_codon:yes gene_type:complete
MFSRDTWFEIFSTVRKNKLRTFLSGFTVALGIFIFIVLFGFGNGLKNQFKEFFLDDATNVLTIFPSKTSKPYKGFKTNRQIEFKNDDIIDLEKNFKFFLENISPRITRYAQSSYKLESNNYRTVGVSPSYIYFEKHVLMKGRYINNDDVTSKKKYAVIGRLVAQDLFGTDVDPLGEYINIDSSNFKIIGIFKDSGGDNEERVIVMPYTTRQLLEKSNDKIGQILVSFRPELGYIGAVAFEDKIRNFFEIKKSIDPTDPRGIFIRNIAKDLKNNQTFSSVLQYIVTFVGLGTLLAGIIGISNIMVFVVKERTKELGVRKALGASPNAIVGTILLESIFITTLFGYIGMIFGVVLLNNMGSSLAEDYFIKNPYVDSYTAIFSTIILIIFGAIAGYIPAKRASKISPIEAMRDE